jgi:hypothetical protein
MEGAGGSYFLVAFLFRGVFFWLAAELAA